MTIKSDKEEARRKILMVLEAMGKAVSAKTLSEHPTLSGMSSKGVASYLRFMFKNKKVRRTRDGSWVALKKKEVKVSATPTGMFFVINVEDHTIQLDVGGLRLPVVIE